MTSIIGGATDDDAMTLAGAGLTAFGFYGMQNGVTTIANALDGGHRRAILGEIGNVIAGEDAAEDGEKLSQVVDLFSSGKAAFEFGESADAMHYLDTVSSAGQGVPPPDAPCPCR